jgi:general secretion pathway protein G
MDYCTSVKRPKPTVSPGECASHLILSWCRRRLTGRVDAFTFIELIITISIIGVLCGIAAPIYADFKYRSQLEIAKAIIREIESGINVYYIRYGTYPATLDDAMQVVPLDPWGYPYQYVSSQDPTWSSKYRVDRNMQPLNTDYDLYSIGMDGQTNRNLAAMVSLDDVLRAGNGAFTDLAARF